jgi:hypothetical protein
MMAMSINSPSAWESDQGTFVACLFNTLAHHQSRSPLLNGYIWPEDFV